MSKVGRPHNCYDHYELKRYKKLFKCDGCKMRGGFGWTFVCKRCDNKLHEGCGNPKAEITHEYYAGSIFAFQKTPSTKKCKTHNKSDKDNEPSRACNACRKDICGFSYHCKDINRDLHPCCSNLPDKILEGDMMFNLKSSVQSKCFLCKKIKVSNDGYRKKPGWSYVSSCKKYHFHVYCMTEMVHEAHIKGVDMGSLVKAKKTSTQASAVIKTIKPVLNIVLAALLGYPTALISSVLVELVASGLQ